MIYFFFFCSSKLELLFHRNIALHGDFCTEGWKKHTHLKCLKGLLSLLMAVAGGCLSLTFGGGILSNLKHEKLVYTF